MAARSFSTCSTTVRVTQNVVFKSIVKLFLAVKGRFRDYYRYGQVRSCMPYWNDFFLCMRLKMETDENKARVQLLRVMINI